MQQTVTNCDYCSTQQSRDASGWIHMDIVAVQDGYVSGTTEGHDQGADDDGVFRVHMDYCPQCWPGLEPKYVKLINSQRRWWQ